MAYDWHTIVVTMTFKDQIDVSLEGFSYQNVIGELAIRRNRYVDPTHPSLVGIGISRADHLIEFAPCAGAFGIIHATISSISYKVSDDAFLWQR